MNYNADMNLIHPLIADAGCPLDGGALFAGNIVAPVDTFFSEHFSVDWGINVAITTSLPWLIIPEDGVGGKTYASDFVVLAVSQNDTTAYKASEMLAHELTHALRWGKNPERSENLFCELVSEGLAVHVEAEFAKTQDKQTHFLETILKCDDTESRKLYNDLKPYFNDKHYEYDGVFFGNDKWPRWIGYLVGYYIVEQCLKKTKTNIFEIIDRSYDDFYATLNAEGLKKKHLEMRD